MKVAVYEDNLFWSSRLAGAIRATGHEAIVLRVPSAPLPDGSELAIVNLTSPTMNAAEVLENLRTRVFIIGHGGHKELADLSDTIKAACDLVTTNGTISMRFESVLAQVTV
ncbi:MAG: hypothetical protein IT205_09420 [Fimbriimonadaceae bacterium]|nr:hypothetical protein [Fimbriimonadaceae bacterium]